MHLTRRYETAARFALPPAMDHKPDL